jgi:hypothetical protein
MLMDVVLPITEAEGVSRNILAYNSSIQADWLEEEEEEGSGDERTRVPYNPHGCFFLWCLMAGDVPCPRHGGRSFRHLHSHSGFGCLLRMLLRNT